jgi:acyl transferase domain-containing protein/acyl-CoA synthetase (AMP-forming)/AMP-acid ligase II/NADPH:quinone reductase-like Zn-dependent oxidoreductase/NAD(P)-dependent dehydrogenase (short-subunit alcohol dehydrogenase family)/acyl carrier protein
MSKSAAISAKTLLEVARHRARLHPEKLAFDYCRFLPDGERHSQLTYRELDVKARAIAVTLQRQGAAGGRVVVLCPSGVDFVAAFFGCIYAGAAAIPVHPPVRNRVIGRVASILEDVDAGFVLATAASQSELKSAVDGLAAGNSLRWCAVDEVSDDTAAQWVAPELDPSTIALLQYTSGSTNTPKGVMVTHANLLHNLETIAQACGDDSGVFWLPLHHDMGLIGGVLETLYLGGSSYFMPPEAFIERPMRWLEAMSRHRATTTTAPNFAYELCIEHSTAEERAALDLSNWRSALCGAEPVRAATMDRFAEAFACAGFRPEAFHPVYGLAEATLLVAGGSESALPVVRHVDGVVMREHRVIDVESGHPAATPFVGCGRTHNGQEIVITDPAARQPCAVGQVGEIWLAGGGVAAGYWGRPEETEQTFQAFLVDGRGPFLRTGDLGFERDGELFVTGRLKDLIIIRGRNYYPEDIEAHVQDSHPGLLRGRGACFSVMPETGSDERLVVVQEVDRGLIGEDDVSDVIAAIRTSVTEHHHIRPDAVVLVDLLGIPTTSSGKIRRNKCRDAFLDGELQVLAQWLAPNPEAPPANASAGDARPGGYRAEEISEWFVAQLSRELDLVPAEIDVSEPFAHYGLDSIHAIRLTSALAAWLGRELSPTLAYEYPTIELASRHLAGDDTADAPHVVAAPPDARPNGVQEPIAIIGIGCRFPGADGPEAFWRLLSEGTDAVTEVPADRWGAEAFSAARVDNPATRRAGFLDRIDEFDAEFFSISPRESARMDPQQRLLLEVAWEAMEDAGQVPEALEGSRTGVFVGISTNEYGLLQFGELANVDAYTGTGSALSIAANRLSYVHDFRGPSMAIDTACSSSLVAIHLACRSLSDGDCTLALAGGVNVVLSPKVSVNFDKAGVMAADGRCKTFDAKADGYVRGEGAGIVVLKPLNQALADGDPIYSVIRGSATNQDGRTNGLMAPSPQSQEAVLTEAYRRAELSPGLVQYVEAHGTGTSLGDAIEAKALGTVLAEGRARDSTCAIGSVKTNIGHLEAAAGVAGLIKVALAMRHRMIPPSLNFTEPNPNIPFDRLKLRVAQTLTAWPENGGRALAGVSSFGFGGANAHVVMAEAPQARATAPVDDTAARRVELLPLSARSPEALHELAARYELALNACTPLADLCYTAGARRGHHDHRLAVIGDSTAAMSDALSAFRSGVAHPGLSAGHRRPGRRHGPVFVFSGQGSQWCGMGQQLYAQEPVFRDALATCDEALRPHLDGSVVAELLAEDNDSWLGDIGLVQPAIFAVQVAQAALWRSWGIEPEAVIGHSLGEVSAAYVSGALTLADAAQVICARARLLRRPVARGAMVVAELTLDEARDLVSGHGREVAIAAANSHRSMVLSGDPEVLADLVSVLEQRSRFCRWIKVDVASHGPQMAALRSDLAAALAGLAPTAASIPMYSTVTGDVVSGPLDAAYWVDNLCSSVNFSGATRQLLDTGHDVFLEVSPHPILLSAVREDAEDMGRECTVLPSMRRDDGGRATPLASLGSLYAHGQSVAWEQLYPWGGRCVTAPTYPWQRRHFWTDATEAVEAGPASIAPAPAGFDRLPWRSPLHSAVDPRTAFCEIELGTELMPVLNDHRVQGVVVVPGAILLELVLSAAAATYGPAKRVLRDVDFRQSLLLADARQRTVQVVLHEDAWGAAQFECYGLEVGDSESAASPGWSLLASGAVAPEEADGADRPDGEPQQPEVIAASCPDVIAGSSFYHRLAEHGLQYGPGFAAVERIWRRDGEAVARLTRADGDGQDFVDGRMLDASFQALAATLPTTGQARDTYLPVGVTELRTYEASSGAAWCHARLRPASDPEPDTIDGDVFLLTDDGQVAMSARGLRLRRVAVDRGATTDGLRDKVFELQWQVAPQAPTEDPAPHGGWLIFSDGTATSHMLRDHLERHSGSCVTVESGAEFERLGPDAYRLDPAQPQHFSLLVDEAFGPHRRPCRGVVHLWSLPAAASAEPDSTSSEWLEAARVAGTTSVLHLTQALTLAGLSDPPRLWLVTNGAQMVAADVDTGGSVNVAAAPLWGMGRSIALEHPELRCARIDLPARPGPDEVSALARELRADGSEADIALRGTSRFVARLAPRKNAAAAARRFTPGTEVAFRMEYPQAGVIDDVRAVAAARPAPGSDEVEIRVQAVGLNFIDAMRALGVYPGQLDGPVRVGIECAGTITAVGDDAREAGLRVGDAVLALAMDGVGSYVTTPAALVAPKPEQLTFEAAAALPIAYLTAYYSLHEQARLRRGEHVLIHSGAGGVGLAAVQVARWLGATVYATAGTAEKHEHLHALGVEHVFDSRSLAFADEVLAATGGKGVDVVLNSLTGEAIAKGLSVLRPSGRFVEIGKRDIYGHGSLRLWQLRHNASYMVVDLAALVVDRPDYVGDLLRTIATGVAHGLWAPPPVRTFPVADTAAAVRCLAQGKQIGKVVISLAAEGSLKAGAMPDLHVADLPVEFDPEATYLITGGLGGLGRAVATWLVEQGARHLVLMGRSAPSTSAQQTLDALRTAGARVVAARGDVADADAVASVIESIRQSMPPLRGVMHAAGVLDDGAVAHLDRRRLRDVMAPKVDGAWNLHELTRDVDLDFFVLFSSAAAVLGSPGQAHYAAANSFLDALAWHRRAEGRSALSINWGPWAEVGLVNRPEQVRHLTRHGIAPMSVPDGVAALTQLLRGDATQAVVLDVDWAQWRSGSTQGVEPALLADLVAAQGGSPARDERDSEAALGDEVRRAAPERRRQLLESYLRDQAASKLGLAPERLAVDSPLNNLGADSLIAMELRTQIQRDLGVAVPVVELLDGPSIATLAGRLDGRLAEPGPTPGPVGDLVIDPVRAPVRATPPPDMPAPDDSARWIDLLAKVPEVSDADVDVLLRELLATREVDSDG